MSRKTRVKERMKKVYQEVDAEAQRSLPVSVEVSNVDYEIIKEILGGIGDEDKAQAPA